MKPLHICYISQEYPPETGWGGIGSYTYEMAHALADAGHRVTIISRAVTKESVNCERGVEVHRVFPSPTWDSIPLFWRLNRFWPGFAWSAMLKLRRIHRQHPIDIVEAAEGRADSVFVSYLPGRPKLVTRLHTARVFLDQFNDANHKQSGYREYWLEKKAIARADLVTAPSRAVVDLTRTWLPLTEQKTWVIPNPTNERAFRPNGKPRGNVVLYVGRLERNKGMEMIAQAIPHVWQSVPAAEFWFVGSDGVDRDGQSWRDKLLASVDSEKKGQLLFKEVSRKEIISTYQRAAVCILPSTWENCPYATLEAMACGTPVVATQCGGYPELIENGVSGFLVPVNDSEAMASRIVELLAAPELRQRIGNNARQVVEERFSVERVLPKMIAAYDYAIAQG